MADKGFFGATKSEINRFKSEVNKDVFGSAKPKRKGGKRRKKR